MTPLPAMISFIIPAYNEEALIGQTVRTLRESADAVLGGRPYEIIVVDDASSDRTADVARHHGARVINVNKRQIAAVRNAGAKAALGDVFIFVDADTLVSSGTLRGAMEALRNGAVAGGAAVRFDTKVPSIAKALAWILMRLFLLLRLAGGCFIYCTRSAFEATGGFDERFYASEEIWMSKALKEQGRFVMVREPVVTSGRKVRMHGLWGLMWASLRVCIGGIKGVQKREGLELWYDGRRESSPPGA